MKFLLMVFIISVLAVQTKAQQAPNQPCSEPETSQLDFWVGDWNLEWTNAEGKLEKGNSHIVKLFGSCVIQENFISQDKSFQGMSLSTYNPNKKVWQQTWVDNTNAYMVFQGGYAEGKMILGNEYNTKEGKKMMSRMVFYNISEKEMDWNWESSKDNGVTWDLLWKIHYKKIN